MARHQSHESLVMNHAPVALAGLPRSGTSAIHARLARHPEIYGVFEFFAARPRSLWRVREVLRGDAAVRALSQLGPLARRAAEQLDEGRFTRLGAEHWVARPAGGAPAPEPAALTEPATQPEQRADDLLRALRASELSREAVALWCSFPEMRDAALAVAKGGRSEAFAVELDRLRQQVQRQTGTPFTIALSLFDLRATEAGATLWLEKSPASLPLWQAAPRAVRVIYVERAPEQIASSLDSLQLHSLFGRSAPTSMVERVRQAQAADHARLDAFPSNSVLRVSLDSWRVNEPYEYSRICEFVGVPRNF